MKTENSVQNGETTLKDGILVIQSFVKEFRKKWFVFLLFILPFLAYFIYTYVTTKVNYQAQYQFIHDVENKGASGLGGILGQFGFGAGAKNNPYQVLEVGNSKLLLTEILYEKTESGDFLINDIIDAYDLRKKWSEKKPEYADFKYVHDSIDGFSRAENIFLQRVQNIVLKGNDDTKKLRDISFDEGGSFYEVKSNSINADLSYNLTRFTYKALKHYYEHKKLEPQIRTTKLLEVKKDSLKSVRDRKLLQLNMLIDRSRNLIYKENLTTQELLQNEIAILTIAYGEAVKNYELSNFNLENSRENFILMDRSFLPLSPVYPSWILAILKAFSIGSFLSILFIVGSKLYRDAMDS